MAERRMFAKKIIDSDDFLGLPATSRLLYYDLSMRADDDGFIDSPKKIMRITGATENDLSILIVKKFLLCFETGVLVVRHWRIHNYIRKDTYNETMYINEKESLQLTSNKTYEFKENVLVDGPSTQVSIDKVSIDNISIDNNSSDKSVPLLPTTTELPTTTYDDTELVTEPKDILANQVIEYLNNKLGTKYQYNSKKTIKYIKARQNEKHSFEHFKTVIDKKYAEWHNTQFDIYLRPSTLFGPKFDEYLNQPWPKQSNNHNTNPNWLGKDVANEVMSEEELKELEDMFEDYRKE